MIFHYSKDFMKALLKYDHKLQLRVRNAILKLPDGDITRIKGVDTDPELYRLRVGKYRILFRMNETDCFIDIIDSRGDVYK
jgi:mRNA interferase RelE/StbE